MVWVFLVIYSTLFMFHYLQNELLLINFHPVKYKRASNKIFWMDLMHIRLALATVGLTQLSYSLIAQIRSIKQFTYAIEQWLSNDVSEPWFLSPKWLCRRFISYKSFNLYQNTLKIIIHCRHLYSTSSGGITQKRSQPQHGQIMLF